MRKWIQFFAKKGLSICVRARFFFQGHFGHFWGPGRVFFQGLGQFSEKGGGFPKRGGGFICFLSSSNTTRLFNLYRSHIRRAIHSSSYHYWAVKSLGPVVIDDALIIIITQYFKRVGSRMWSHWLLADILLQIIQGTNRKKVQGSRSLGDDEGQHMEKRKTWNTINQKSSTVVVLPFPLVNFYNWNWCLTMQG